MSTHLWYWIILFSTTILSGTSAFADTEPNNSLAEANELDLNAVQTGDLFTNPANDTNDWYEISVPENGIITLSGSFGEDLTGYVYIYGGNGAQLTSSLVQGTSFSISANCVGSGNVYIRLLRSSGSGTYSLEVNSEAPLLANDSEPNNTAEEITDTFMENEEWTGHLGYSSDGVIDANDYFSIVSPHNGNVTLTATYEEGLTGYIYLNRKNGSNIGFALISGTTGAYTAFCEAGDTLIARINRTSGCGTYTASFNTSDLTNANDAEPNSNGGPVSSIEAIQDTYQEGETWTGQIGYYDVDSGTDLIDYYYIVSPRDGNVTLTATYDEGLAGYIYLYEKDGTNIGFSYIDGETGSYVASCYAADTLVAAIARSSGCGSYSASFATAGLTYENDMEPNNDGGPLSSIEVIQATYQENEEWEGHLGYTDADNGVDLNDYYYIVSPEDGNVTLTAEYDAALAGYIYLYEKDGTQIGFTYIAGTTGSYTANCYASDTLVARISRSSGCGSYIASFETSELVYGDDEDGNDSFETATATANYQTKEGHLGYVDADLAIDNNDWYEISVVDVPFELDAKLSKGEDFLGYLYFHNSAGGTVDWVYHGGLLETAYVTTITEPGTYYLRVNRSSGCGSYSLGDFCGNYPEVAATAGGPTEFCLGESVLLSATEGLAAYSWRLNGNEVGTEQTLMATEQGLYEVVGYNTNGCATISNDIEVSYLPDSDSDGICDIDDNCPNTPGLIGDTCDDGDDATENDILNESCDCEGTPIAVASLLTLDCGESVIQISWAQAGLNDGGTATSETRTIYAFGPDNSNPTPSYEGSSWPYVIISGSLNTDPNITAELTTNEDNVLLVNGWPAYQFTGDSGESDANGTFGPWSYFLTNGDQSQEACIGTIAGTVDWDFDCGERSLDVDVYEAGTNNSIGSYSATISAEGTFEIEVTEFGTYDIYVKVEGYLATSISDTEVAVGLNILDFGSIQAGDLNGDNGVNIIDFSILNGAFGTSSGDSNFNPIADLNCDGGVNIVDVSILNGGFGMTGDAPVIGVP